MNKYDVIVVGGGIGLSLVEIAIANGKTCALIERGKLGGTCLTRGCIPSKVLVAPADMIRSARHASSYGVDCKIEDVDWNLISERMWSQIDSSDEIAGSFEDFKNLKYYKGTAEFIGERNIIVKYPDDTVSEEMSADTIILCPGARTYIPQIPGLENVSYLSSETFFGAGFPKKIPKSVAVIGAGAFGSEFTHIFSALGAKVYLVEKKSRILPLEEESISAFVKADMEAFGIEVFVDTAVIKCESSGSHKSVSIKNNSDGAVRTIVCDEIFVATGIMPNSDILKLSNTKIKTDVNGWIETDKYLRTSVDGIWALGDINGKFQFRHKANYEAAIAGNNIFNTYGEMRPAYYTSVPWAIFTYPQVAHVGLTQEQALKIHDGVFVGIKHYSSIAKGFALGYEKGNSDDGFVKLIADKEFNIVGAHIVGEHASILIQPYVNLMNTGHTCIVQKQGKFIRKRKPADKCKTSTSLEPMSAAMVIHPALSELTAWVIGEMKWVES